METSNLKNMMVLKSVPSNIIEEAIIILKKNIKIKEFEMQNQSDIKQKKKIKKDASLNNITDKKDYIVKEAEMILNQYITKIENNKKQEMSNKKLNKKYKTIKKWLYITSFLSLIEMIMLFIK